MAKSSKDIIEDYEESAIGEGKRYADKHEFHAVLARACKKFGAGPIDTDEYQPLFPRQLTILVAALDIQQPRAVMQLTTRASLERSGEKDPTEREILTVETVRNYIDSLTTHKNAAPEKPTPLEHASMARTDSILETFTAMPPPQNVR